MVESGGPASSPDLSPQLLTHLCISLASLLIDYPYIINYTALHFIAARIPSLTRQLP